MEDFAGFLGVDHDAVPTVGSDPGFAILIIWVVFLEPVVFYLAVLVTAVVVFDISVVTFFIIFRTSIISIFFYSVSTLWCWGLIISHFNY